MFQITKQFLADIKSCKSFSVIRDRKGTGCIRLSFEIQAHGKKTDMDKSYLLPVSFSSHQCADWDERTNKNVIYFAADKSDTPCNAWVSWYGSDSTEMTAINSLKVGDYLSFHFQGNNNNQYISAAGLHHDELTMIVDRGDRKTGKRLKFLMVTSTCPNNSARMIGGCNGMRDIDKKSRDFENRVICNGLDASCECQECNDYRDKIASQELAKQV